MRWSAMRQLRAYVYLDNAYFEQHGADWKITYVIKNFGQTPAHKVKVTEAAEVVDWNAGAPIVPVASYQFNLGVMAPGGDFFENEADLKGTATLNDLTYGTKAIFLVGRIDYRDIFKKKQWSTFQYYIGGAMGCSGREMCADEDGNDAT
jgi:hypothetical protein